ncbi:MAG: ATP-binding protein [Bacteroidia bacterium]|nr:ATP-binding protein [Bacteroidia bacterium]
MKINQVEICHWRSVRQATIEMEDLMIFIGQNNHGKSNLLSALLFFFGEIKAAPPDFHATEVNLYVEVTFRDLNPHEQAIFEKYVDPQHTMKVRRFAYRDGTSGCRGYIRQPVPEWLQEEKLAFYCKRDHCRHLPIAAYLPAAGKISRDAYRRAIRQYLEENEIEYRITLEPGPFMGSDRASEGGFGQVYFIPAVKNASDELTPRETSVFGKMLSQIIRKISHQNEKYRSAQRKMLELAQILNKTTAEGKVNPNRPAEITELEQLLQQSLGNWKTVVDIEINPPTIEKVFKLGTSVWIDDGTRTDLSRKGHGLQRSFLFALLKATAQLTHQNQAEAPEIDPPALHLHSSFMKSRSFTSILRRKKNCLLHSKTWPVKQIPRCC